MWNIAKEFSCDFGHRVWTQKLNEEYSLDAECVCLGQHGHLLTIIIYLKSDSLNDQGMVTDFKHLNWFKKFIDQVLDHRMVLDLNDPALSHFYPCTKSKNFQKIFIEDQFYFILNPEEYKNEDISIRKIYERLTLLDFVPTSENLSKWIFDIVQKKMSKINIKVSQVQFFETPKSQSNYYA